MRERKDFCTECRRETSYTLKKIKINQTIREKEYTFEITAAFCNECGGEMGIPGLMDYNVKEMDEQYRKAEEIITVEDIERLMKLYNIGKAPLSLALGFGEVTITRYLAGQVPSKEYSDIMLHALASAEGQSSFSGYFYCSTSSAAGRFHGPWLSAGHISSIRS